MPQILYTVDEYAVTVNKKDTHWIVFNKTYNDVNAFGKKLTHEESHKYLDKSETDYEAQKEFLSFMKENLPHVKILKVFDLVSIGYLTYPYLGSYIIDIEAETPEYDKLMQKYENKDGTPKSNNALIWVLPYKEAQKIYKKRKAFLDAEFGD